MGRGEWNRTIVLSGAILALITIQFKSCSELSEYKRSFQASQDTIAKTRNKLGQEIAEKSAIIAFNEREFLRIQYKDSSLQALQKIVKSFEGKLSTAISIANKTNSIGNSPTKVTDDQILTRNDTVFVFPKYTSNWNDEWDEGQIIAQKDTIFRSIQIKNKYELTVGKSNHWFKKNESQVKVLNLNPNTTTQEINAFQVQSQQKKLGISIQVGYGFSSGIKPSTYLGIGLGYQLISIR